MDLSSSPSWKRYCPWVRTDWSQGGIDAILLDGIRVVLPIVHTVPIILPRLAQNKVPSIHVYFLTKHIVVVFTLKFERRARKLVGFQDCANQGVDCVRIDICRFGCDTGIDSLWRTSTDNDDGIWLASRRYISDSTKGERLESKLS